MKIVKDFVAREIAGEYVLVPTGETSQEFNGMLTMTETANFIWKHLEETESFEALVDLITDNFEVERQIAAQDAAGFVNELLRHGMVKPSREDGKW